MRILHLLVDGPTDLATRIIEAQSEGNDIKVIDMSDKGVSYESIIEEIFSYDKVISW